MKREGCVVLLLAIVTFVAVLPLRCEGYTGGGGNFRRTLEVCNTFFLFNHFILCEKKSRNNCKSRSLKSNEESVLEAV